MIVSRPGAMRDVFLRLADALSCAVAFARPTDEAIAAIAARLDDRRPPGGLRSVEDEMPEARRDLGLHALLDLIERALQGRLDWRESIHQDKITKAQILRLEARSQSLGIVYEYCVDDFRYLRSQVIDGRGHDVEETLRRLANRWHSPLEPAPGRGGVATEAVGDVRQALAGLRYAVRSAVMMALPTDETARAALERLTQKR